MIESSKAQIEYCGRNGKPVFAPYSGICPHCMRNIYDAIDPVHAGKQLINGCPYCHRSFCD